MDNNTLIIVGAIIVVVLILAFVYLQMQKSKNLKSRFGAEYDRTVEEAGGKRQAEAQLHKLEKRVERYSIHPLTAGEAARFTTAWTTTQSDFVDNPKAAVAHADSLLGEVMTARGYPVSDFEQSSADLSVDHPVVVQNYRAAHDIALREGRGDAGTEDLRQAMIHYRTLFDELVAEPAATARVKATS
jgi:FtsZ-interacting cell division protein ZipA